MREGGPPMKPDPTFEGAWRCAEEIPGWLTRDQARLLYDEATAAGAGATLLEIGSHQGRSTVVLGTVAQQQRGQVIAVDPFVDGRLFGGPSTKQKFERHVRDAGVGSVVELVEDYSTRARGSWSRDFDFLYIDGKHDYWTLSDDLRWVVHLPAGARYSCTTVSPRSASPSACCATFCFRGAWPSSGVLVPWPCSECAQPSTIDRWRIADAAALVDPQRLLEGAAPAAVASLGPCVRTRLALRPLLAGQRLHGEVEQSGGIVLGEPPTSYTNSHRGRVPGAHQPEAHSVRARSHWPKAGRGHLTPRKHAEVGDEHGCSETRGEQAGHHGPEPVGVGHGKVGFRHSAVQQLRQCHPALDPAHTQSRVRRVPVRTGRGQTGPAGHAQRDHRLGTAWWTPVPETQGRQPRPGQRPGPLPPEGQFESLSR